MTERLSTIRDASVFTGEWDAYAGVHTKIRALDDGGAWDDAVQLAVGSGPGSSNAAFAPFDAGVASFVASTGTGAVDGLRGHQAGLVLGCLLTFLAGLGAAWAGSRGVAARLEEYR